MRHPIPISSLSRLNRASPLRYPGGKSNFTPFFAHILEVNNLTGCDYYEPYAGGAGAAINLLLRGQVSHAFLNDADWSIFCFWRAVLRQPVRFCESILNASLDINEWQIQKNIYKNPKSYSVFEVGFSTFYLNRCNRSGIVKGAGPVGGIAQTGRYKIDCRFPKNELIERVKRLAKLRGQITLSNDDAMSFLKKSVPTRSNKIFAYLDPPYLEQGRRLYFDRYQFKDHEILAEYLCSRKKLHWLVSYDNHDKLDKIYHKAQSSMVCDIYFTPRKIRRSEILFFPPYLEIKKYSE